MTQIDRDRFERQCVARGDMSVQRHMGGLFHGRYIDQNTQRSWELLCEYADILAQLDSPSNATGEQSK